VIVGIDFLCLLEFWRSFIILILVRFGKRWMDRLIIWKYDVIEMEFYLTVKRFIEFYRIGNSILVVIACCDEVNVHLFLAKYVIWISNIDNKMLLFFWLQF